MGYRPRKDTKMLQHDFLEPFFQDNESFEIYLDEQLKDDQSPSRQQELVGYKRQIENDNIQPSSFFMAAKNKCV